MTYVYILKRWADSNCNESLTLGVYANMDKAVAELDRIRSTIKNPHERWQYDITSEYVIE